MNGDVRYVLTTEVRGSDTRRLQMVDSACSCNRREAEGGGGRKGAELIAPTATRPPTERTRSELLASRR